MKEEGRMDKLKQETGISYREAILFRGCAMVIAATRGSSRDVDLARCDDPEAIALLKKLYGEDAIIMSMELVQNAEHLCDSCRKDFATCDGRDKAYGCDFGYESIPEEADKVLVCAGYEARPVQPSIVPGRSWTSRMLRWAHSKRCA
jgi:hypothetical protein